MLLSSLTISLFLLTLMGLSVGEAMLLVHIDRARTTSSTLDTLWTAALADARTSVAADMLPTNSATNSITEQDRVVSLPLCLQSSTSCGILMHEYFLPGTVVAASGARQESAQPCTAENTDVCNLEQAGNIAEGRSELTVRIVLTNLDGSEIASREKVVRFQLLHVAPYALIVGVADTQSASSSKGTGDIGGLPPDASGQSGTLIMSYDPCRSVPTQSAVGTLGEGLSWGNWQGTSHSHGVEASCVFGAGAVSQFANGPTPVQQQNTSGWSN